MAVTWTLRGESGKAWGATAQPLAYYGLTAGTVRVASLQSDQMVLQQAVKAYDFSTYAQPDIGQIVAIYRNGTRFFRGEVTRVDKTLNGVTITVSGPFNRLFKTDLVGIDGFSYPTAKPKRFVIGSLDSYTSSYINLLANMYHGTGPSQLNINVSGVGMGTNGEAIVLLVGEKSVGQSILDFLAMEPADLVSYDYAYSPNLMKITRSSSWTTRTLSIADGTIKSVTLAARTDLVVPYGGDVLEKWTATEGDSWTSGGMGTLPAYSRPGYTTASRTFAAGAGNWFQWTVPSSAPGAPLWQMSYADWSSYYSGFYTSSQTPRTRGLVNHTTARIEALLSRKNYTPWEGRIVIKQENPGAITFGGCKVQIDGAAAEWETMTAPVLGHDIDLVSGYETITVGPPYGYALQCPYFSQAQSQR